MLTRIDDKLKASISTSVDMASSTMETRHAEDPLAALQQRLRNAVMHRTDDATNAPVRLTCFTDRIEAHAAARAYEDVAVLAADITRSIHLPALV